MKIEIQSIEPKEARYDTLGDYFINKDGDLIVQTVKQSKDEQLMDDKSFLIFLHELVELKLCLNAGVSFESIDDFDFKFTGEGEPGDEPDAPYREQHRRAMLIEHMMANFLGLTDYGRVE